MGGGHRQTGDLITLLSFLGSRLKRVVRGEREEKTYLLVPVAVLASHLKVQPPGVSAA
jgi:hypothetical protein